MHWRSHTSWLMEGQRQTSFVNPQYTAHYWSTYLNRLGIPPNQSLSFTFPKEVHFFSLPFFGDVEFCFKPGSVPPEESNTHTEIFLMQWLFWISIYNLIGDNEKHISGYPTPENELKNKHCKKRNPIADIYLFILCFSFSLKNKQGRKLTYVYNKYKRSTDRCCY